ncbi:hypothetical protein MN086_03610 [Sulfurovum sp. XGS-02]|uniref:hypothetical protein n=1 Tax=Sulfurovum sp. XGS-02 TaxID=2925411 RepID=UPI00205867A9|nr:hypothetical protein [Sulfurovum sp. XGS-02]UPT78236.1 hypothetical protein MN086_03610 [Sulfurovum sp. XGS-02]
MKKIGISIDYSNICKDYNTSYLDRDNKDPATSKCMKQVLTWTQGFLSELLDHFGYQIHHLHSSTPVKVEDVASKRFLFYSLEKEITLQSYVIQKAYVEYGSLVAWELESEKSILIQNEEDGGGIFLYFNENSTEHQWIIDKLKTFSLDEVPFHAK